MPKYPPEQLSRMKRNHSRAIIVLAAVVPAARCGDACSCGKRREKMTTPCSGSRAGSERNPAA
mgnify:CR=1 FL=1